MITGYRFDDRTPKPGDKHHAFRKLEDCKHFLRLQGGLPLGHKIYEIKGDLVKDHGGPDGLEIKVRESRVVS